MCKSKLISTLLILSTLFLTISSITSCNKNAPVDSNPVFEIDDRRIEKTDLNGKYVSVDNEDIFFEIKDSEAVLHKNYEKYLFGDTKDVEIEKNVLIITENDGNIELDFQFIPSDSDTTYSSWFRTLDTDYSVFYWGNHEMYAHKKIDESSEYSIDSTSTTTTDVFDSVSINEYEAVSKFFVTGFPICFEEGETVNVDLLMNYYRIFEMRDEQGNIKEDLQQYKTDNIYERYEICIPKNIVNEKIMEHFSVELDDSNSEYNAPNKEGYYLIKAYSRGGSVISMEEIQEDGNCVIGTFTPLDPISGEIIGEKLCVCIENPNSEDFRIVYSRKITEN